MRSAFSVRQHLGPGVDDETLFIVFKLLSGKAGRIFIKLKQFTKYLIHIALFGYTQDAVFSLAQGSRRVTDVLIQM